MNSASTRPKLEHQHQLGQFLQSLDKTTHDLLMISLNLEMDAEQNSSDKQNKIKTEILKRTVKGGAA